MDGKVKGMIIKELNVLTCDLVGTEEFYSQVLDFPVFSKDATSVSFNVGHSVLTFIYSDKTKPVYHFAFNIPENKLSEALEWVKKRVQILPYSEESIIADYSNWNAHAFYFHDNNSNILEFIAHHDLDNQASAPFSALSLIGLCEIGVPVNDVPKTCEILNGQYAIPYFQKGPRTPVFSVMGDAHGFLIVNQTGRAWIPTQQPVDRFYTRFVIENDGKQQEIILE